ncbi:MAG: hypothetical protein AAF721_12670 [Myxococcota bacterium]
MSDGLRAPWGAWLLAAIYVGVGAASFPGDTFLHDEGLLTHLFADLLARDVWPAFFLQKVRPPLSVLYAPAASAGVGPFLWMHLVLCAGAVPLLAGVARRLGHRAPNVAAATVALSPMYIAGGAAGLSNADAVLGVCLVMWLWAHERELLAGLVLGILVWVRAELGVFVLVMMAWAIRERRPRAVVGLALWPLAYGAAGAVYHAYVPWMLHYPPALSEPMPDNPFWQAHHRAASLAALAGTAVALTPAVAMLALARPARWHPLERWWAAFGGLFCLALVVLPRWQVFNFDQSPRYLMPLLPIVALSIGRAVATWDQVTARRAVPLLATAVLGVVVHRSGGSLLLAFSVVGVGLAAGAAGMGRPRLATFGLLVLLVMGPRHFGGGARIARQTQAAALVEMTERLAEIDPAGTRPVVTNEPILAAFLRRSGGQPTRPVYYLVQADQVHELTALTNPANGQRERIFAALSRGLYGVPILPDALSPEALPAGALIAVTPDPRLDLVMPPETWRPALSVVSRSPRVMVAERREGGRP